MSVIDLDKARAELLAREKAFERGEGGHVLNPTMDLTSVEPALGLIRPDQKLMVIIMEAPYEPFLVDEAIRLIWDKHGGNLVFDIQVDGLYEGEVIWEDEAANALFLSGWFHVWQIAQEKAPERHPLCYLTRGSLGIFVACFGGPEQIVKPTPERLVDQVTDYTRKGMVGWADYLKRLGKTKPTTPLIAEVVTEPEE